MPTPRERLRDRIRAEGAIPFAAFMEEALYGRGGYYARPALPIGEEGDYVTGSSWSPLFGRVTARLIRRLDEALGAPAELFEAGYGDGKHLENVLAAFPPGSPRRDVRAWDRVARPLAPGVERIERLEVIPAGSIRGLIFSYELFDALPVHRLIGLLGGRIGEVWVGLDGEGRFVWREGELSDRALLSLLDGPHVGLEPGQIADLSPGWRPLYAELARRLDRGLLVTCDYGFEKPRLLDPRIRRHGTLGCFSRHRAHRDPFQDVGEQDLTAHVDFSALLGAGEQAGLTTIALTRQAFWLTACGLFEEIAGANAETRRQAMDLLDGEGMGEEIRVLVQSKGIDPEGVLDLDKLG
ncbi:MAG TPA: SAM-dependent methyltransferase [Thermoanaerobaculia bacterium]|nr:SAM-dependent methyltransferase [Thermoanaerobaculia bacterium]